MEDYKIKVSIYDDNHALRDSLSKLFVAFPEFNLLGSFSNGIHIVDNCKKQKPDVILMDIDMPGITGIEAVLLVKKEFPEIKVLMLTVFDEDDKVFQSICNGAVGYLLKKSIPMEILDGVKQAFDGGAPMSPSIAVKVLKMFRNQGSPVAETIDLNEREHEVLSHLTKGLSYKMIAIKCNISIDTVRFYIKRIYEKLHVHSMTEAVSKALKNKWV